MGVVAERTRVMIQGTKLKAEGPLLITHWGMSGPAILKLSAFGARVLSELNYDCRLQVNWANIQNDQIVLEDLNGIAAIPPQKDAGEPAPLFLAGKLVVVFNRKSGLAKGQEME